MKKVIIVLTGEPEQKSNFIEQAKKMAWVNNVNPKNNLGRMSQQLCKSKERDDSYWNFLAECLKLANKYFDYENTFVREKIDKFLADEDKVKTSVDFKEFDKFLLIVHGLSKKLREDFKDEFPLYVIRLGTSDQPSSETAQDFVLETDVVGYDEEITRVINILTNK